MKTIQTGISAGHRLEGEKSTAGRIIAGGLLAASLLMSGCASYNRDHITVGSVPDDYRKRHPIVVAETPRVRDIVVASHQKTMPLRDKDIAREVARQFKARGAKTLSVHIPTGGTNEAAARRFAHQAIHEMKDEGIAASSIVISHYDAAGMGDSAPLRLSFTDLTAGVASKCGQWSDDLGLTHENRNYDNFGCASQNNLAQMVANPSDLVTPRAMSEIDSTKRTLVIEDWRTTTTDLPDF